ncbi:protein GLUTAMINE DUMPER 3 isoform X1 [Aegilops tauschii subsp. strangulata]|nr:protein GLUTAMINE DUMPER 3 isoform X1 [Aegilops tauschii subsp. strangulata]
MRPGAGFNATAAATKAAVAPLAAGAAHSAWHSPVPYLFGGLAAMLGLIAFALLILACSYWKLSGYLEGSAGRGDAEGSATDGAKPVASDLAPAAWEEKVLVVMAGDVEPTYLATPMSSRDRSGKGGEEEKKVSMVAMASTKDAGNGEHSQNQRERDDHHFPEGERNPDQSHVFRGVLQFLQ